MILLPVFEAAEQLQAQGIGCKIVSVINPRRLYRPGDVAWSTCAQPDGEFMSDQEFAAWFAGEALIGVTGGSSLMLEPLTLRYTGPRDIFAWKRGETTATPAELMDYNGLTAQALAERAKQLLC